MDHSAGVFRIQEPRPLWRRRVWHPPSPTLVATQQADYGPNNVGLQYTTVTAFNPKPESYPRFESSAVVERLATLWAEVRLPRTRQKGRRTMGRL